MSLSSTAHRVPLTTGEGSLIERMRAKLEASKRLSDARVKDYIGAMVILECALEDAIRELERGAR